MGDVAMTVPVVHSLANQYPHLQITVLSQPFARSLFMHMPSNVRFMEADIRHQYHGIHGLNTLYRRLKEEKFTAIADLHDILRTKYLRLRFNLDKYRIAHINKHHHERRMLTSSSHRVMSPLPTSFDNYSAVLRSLGYPVRLEFKSIFGSEKGDYHKIAERIGPRIREERWIGIAPFAAHRGKVYPAQKVAETVRLLLERDPSCRLFFFGNGAAEHESISQIINGRARCTDASAVLSNLHEELILMSHLDAMMSMDSANMHLASLVGIRVVSVWGATHRYAGFLGWHQDARDVAEIDLPCRPCSIFGNRKCRYGDYRCMDIPPTVIADMLLADR